MSRTAAQKRPPREEEEEYEEEGEQDRPGLGEAAAERHNQLACLETSEARAASACVSDCSSRANASCQLVGLRSSMG